jgi:hypothetical protein
VTEAPTRPVRPKDALLADGWTRRSLVGPDRAQELSDTYSQLGFEVHLRSLAPVDITDCCTHCSATLCTSYVVVYTRPARSESP